MARPLTTSDPQRNGSHGNFSGRAAAEPPRVQGAATRDGSSANGRQDMFLEDMAPTGDSSAGLQELLQELEQLRMENQQLRGLCAELEQALHEATLQGGSSGTGSSGEYEGLLEEKNEIIRSLHQELEELRACQESHSAAPPAPKLLPREEELLALSEELERERRQLQEDEQTLMEQMKEMEIGMARERAEMARQRNDLQRLQSEIRHELERLERNGALQSKMESLKSKLQDATTRRGAAPGAGSGIFGRIFGPNGQR